MRERGPNWKPFSFLLCLSLRMQPLSDERLYEKKDNSQPPTLWPSQIENLICGATCPPLHHAIYALIGVDDNRVNGDPSSFCALNPSLWFSVNIWWQDRRVGKSESQITINTRKVGEYKSTKKQVLLIQVSDLIQESESGIEYDHVP